MQQNQRTWPWHQGVVQTAAWGCSIDHSHQHGLWWHLGLHWSFKEAQSRKWTFSHLGSPSLPRVRGNPAAGCQVQGLSLWLHKLQAAGPSLQTGKTFLSSPSLRCIFGHCSSICHHMLHAGGRPRYLLILSYYTHFLNVWKFNKGTFYFTLFHFMFN